MANAFVSIPNPFTKPEPPPVVYTEIDASIPGEFRCKGCGAVDNKITVDLFGPLDRGHVKGCACGMAKASD